MHRISRCDLIMTKLQATNGRCLSFRFAHSLSIFQSKFARTSSNASEKIVFKICILCALHTQLVDISNSELKNSELEIHEFGPAAQKALLVK